MSRQFPQKAERLRQTWLTSSRRSSFGVFLDFFPLGFSFPFPFNQKRGKTKNTVWFSSESKTPQMRGAYCELFGDAVRVLVRILLLVLVRVQRAAVIAELMRCRTNEQFRLNLMLFGVSVYAGVFACIDI